MIYEQTLHAFTDGSSYSNPRRGGMGILFVWIDQGGQEVAEEHPQSGYRQSTNNEMELMACTEALRLASNHPQLANVQRVVLSTDSMYVTSNLKRARFEWASQKWFNRAGRPIENATLWKDLLKAIGKVRKRVEFKWVKGHSKNVYNKSADKLAKASAKGTLAAPLVPTTVRKKKTSSSVDIGCVPMEGQTLRLRIITDRYLRKPQAIFKYKYEVLPESGDHAGKVDLIFSTLCLAAGHHYEVRVNNEPKNPRIAELVRELARTADPAIESGPAGSASAEVDVTASSTPPTSEPPA
ncbi:MAG: ribonuclease H [Vicinamibacteria bacterium]